MLGIEGTAVTKAVFQDGTGRRAARVAWAGWLLAALAIVMGVVFAVTLLAPTQMAAAKLPGEISALRVQRLEKQPQLRV